MVGSEDRAECGLLLEHLGHCFGTELGNLTLEHRCPFPSASHLETSGAFSPARPRWVLWIAFLVPRFVGEHSRHYEETGSLHRHDSLFPCGGSCSRRYVGSSGLSSFSRPTYLARTAGSGNQGLRFGRHFTIP